MPSIIFALLVAVVVGGGTSLAAQNALPGDALWSFKVGVNETIEDALAPGGKAQAAFDISAIETRMQEASILSANSRLTADTKAELEANLNAHAKSATDQVAKLQAKGDYQAAADVAARFQASLGKQSSGGLDIRATLDAANALSADASAKAEAK